VISYLVLAAGALITFWLWHGRWRPKAPDFDARFALTATLGLLVSPHLYPHDSLLLVLPAALFYNYLRRANRPRTLFAAVALAGPLLFLIGEQTLDGTLGIRVPTLLMLLLAGWIAAELARSRRRVSSGQWAGTRS
jgi:hypothetical protein